MLGRKTRSAAGPTGHPCLLERSRPALARQGRPLGRVRRHRVCGHTKLPLMPVFSLAPPQLTPTVTCATDIYNGPGLIIRPFHSVHFDPSVERFPDELLIQRLRRAGGDSVRFHWSGWLRGPTQNVGFDFPCERTIWSHSTFRFVCSNLRFHWKQILSLDTSESVRHPATRESRQFPNPNRRCALLDCDRQGIDNPRVVMLSKQRIKRSVRSRGRLSVRSFSGGCWLRKRTSSLCPVRRMNVGPSPEDVRAAGLEVTYTRRLYEALACGYLLPRALNQVPVVFHEQI